MQALTHRSQHAQRGAVMAVSLILLLVMTVIGVSTMRSSVMEVRMAGSAQQQEDALRDAERTLAMAEDQVDTWVTDGAFTPAGGGFYRANPPEVRVADWTGITSATGAASRDTSTKACRSHSTPRLNERRRRKNGSRKLQKNLDIL